MLVTEANYEQSIAALTQGGEIVCDTETTGLDWRNKDRVCGVCLLAGEKSFYFPFRHEEGANLPERKLPDLVSRILPPDRHSVWYHYSFDYKMLFKEGMSEPHTIDDSLLGAHVLNENEPSFKMENICTKYIDPDAYKEEEMLVDKLIERFGGSRKAAKGNLWRMPATDVWEYGEQDVWSTRKLRDWQRPHFKEWKLEEVYRGVMEYQLAIAASQQRGMQLNIDRVHRFMEEADGEADKRKAIIAKAAGYEANPNSSKQMQALFEVGSTAKDVMQMMAGSGNSLAQTLLEFRVFSKASGTYYRPFLESRSLDDVLRPNINTIGTISGRPSCTKPNLLSIPRDVKKYPIKRVFVARPGMLYLEMDYSQAEMRIATHYAQDRRMTELLMAGADLHQAVADEQDMPRDVAKRLNFSVIYGIGARTFSKTYKIPYAKSKGYLSKYHLMFPGFRRLYNNADQKAQEQGYIRHFTGRTRRFNCQRAPTHKASSNLVQGAVAEMMRLATCRLRREKPHFHQLLSVYDSFLFEIPENVTIGEINEVRAIMEDQPWCSIPMKVDVKLGPNWGEMKDVPR